MSQLTSKDLSIIEDQLNHECLAQKKAEAYAQSFQDAQLRTMAQSLAARHQARFKKLYDFLSQAQ